MVLLIDNYDSFTYNLYQYIGRMYTDIMVKRNDELTLAEISKLAPQAIVISPGPGTPDQAGISEEVIKNFSGRIPILGICLGHQAICEVFGGKIVRAKYQLHGKQTNVQVDTSAPIFFGLPKIVQAARYHSLVAERESLPDCLEIISEDAKGAVMAVRHKEHQTYGLQFHPESIMTDVGKRIIANFLIDANINIDPSGFPVIPDSEKTELKPLIAKSVSGEHLTQEEARSAVDIIMSGKATPSQTAALFTAMRMNVETVEEITGCALGMRGKMTTVPHSREVLEIVGTGGDLSQSFNISTTSTFVISSLGQPVAKHGNRSVSSLCGAADVLESLGVKITTTPNQAQQCIEEVGMSFLFAQSYHRAMRFVAPVRGQIGVRTVFNILGPLTNPAKAEYNIIGVYEERLLDIVAEVLNNLGVKHSLVVYGRDRLDEISISDSTGIREIIDGEIKSYDITPEEVGLKRGKKEDIVGGNAEDNAAITRGILSGEIRDAKRDIVLLNSGAGLYICGKAPSIAEGVKLAAKAIDDGLAIRQLEKFVEFSNRV